MPKEHTGATYKVDPESGFLTPGPCSRADAITVQQKKDWLACYRQTANFGKACKLAGINRTTVFSHFEIDQPFHKQFLEMVEELCDDKEEQINTMANKNLLAAFGFLKAYRPHIWNERKTVNFNQSNASKLEHLLSKMKKGGKLVLKDATPALELVEEDEQEAI